MVHVGMSQRPTKGANKQVAHPVVADYTLEEVIAPGTAASGYIGKQILGSAKDAAKNVAGERT